MKTFEEILKESLDLPLNEFIKLEDSDFDFLNESERAEVQDILMKFGNRKVNELDEGILGSIIGGLTGFIVGPAIGKVIANSLGIERGIIYDMLTSRLVSIALGSAITKYMSSNKK